MARFKKFIAARSESFTEIDAQPVNPFTILQLLEQTKVLLLTTHLDLIFTCSYNSTMSYVFKCWRGDCVISAISSNTFEDTSRPIAIIPETERSNNALIVMSSGTVIKWDYLRNTPTYKVPDNQNITLCHYFRDILLVGGNDAFKGYKINRTEAGVTDLIRPMPDIQIPSSGTMLVIITLEDCVFCVCSGGIEKYVLVEEEEGEEDVISHVALSDQGKISLIITAISFNQYILTGHDNSEVIIWNDILGIVRKIKPHTVRHPVKCILALNEDYFAISVGTCVFVIYKYTIDDVYAQSLQAHRDMITSLLLVGRYLISFCKEGVTRLWELPVLRKSLRTRTECRPLPLVGEMLSPGMSHITSTGDNDILLYGGTEGLLVWRHTRNTLISYFRKIRETNMVESDGSSTESYDSIEPC